MDKVKELGIIAAYIPQEMYWAYEAVRRSGYWNMMCFDSRFKRFNHENKEECLQIMDEIYIKFCVHTNADISDERYKHMTDDHVKIIQHLFSTLREYYPPMPEGVVELKLNQTRSFSF